jgi:hypothetical protein
MDIHYHYRVDNGVFGGSGVAPPTDPDWASTTIPPPDDTDQPVYDADTDTWRDAGRLAAVESRLDSVAALAIKADATAQEVAQAARDDKVAPGR